MRKGCEVYINYLQNISKQHNVLLQALIDAHDQIGTIWLERGSGVDEKLLSEDKGKTTEDESEENGDMPVETVKVVGLRKVPGQPLGLTVCVSVIYIPHFSNLVSTQSTGTGQSGQSDSSGFIYIHTVWILEANNNIDETLTENTAPH